jgi:NADPH:quinone reductase-like Zn-dependent oxidoreductase
MQALVQNAYGTPDVLQLKEVDKPAIKDDQVLVKVLAASINAGDIFSMRGSPWLARFTVGFPKPKDYILGWDLAGIVEAVGNQVTQFKPGDEVFGSSSHSFAEYVSAGENTLASKPANLTFEQAAAVPTAAITALQGLRDAGKVQPGQKVLINGASGGVGTFAVQIAKSFGAEVSGVCSPRNAEMVRSLGADQVFDYTQQDFTKSGQQYDLILDNIANHSFADLRRVLSPQGRIIPNSGHGGMSYVFKAFLLSPFTRQVESPLMTSQSSRDLVVLKELIEAGKVKPVIDRIFPLSESPQAFRYLEENHAQGKVVITMKDSGENG